MKTINLLSLTSFLLLSACSEHGDQAESARENFIGGSLHYYDNQSDVVIYPNEFPIHYQSVKDTVKLPFEAAGSLLYVTSYDHAAINKADYQLYLKDVMKIADSIIMKPYTPFQGEFNTRGAIILKYSSGTDTLFISNSGSLLLQRLRFRSAKIDELIRVKGLNK